MKTILLKVEVPDGYEFKINSIKVFKTEDSYHEKILQAKQITLPSEEEIKDEADNTCIGTLEEVGFINGATWLLNKLK